MTMNSTETIVQLPNETYRTNFPPGSGGNTTANQSWVTVNTTMWPQETTEGTPVDNRAVLEYMESERYTSVIIPIIFGLIFIIGLVGNLLVIIVVISNRQMRTKTNILIVSLAIADLCFIIFCVPFTATIYVVKIYPFGDAWCKIVQYMIYVCAYASVYTLVVMSLDRYLAVVHPISSMEYRTERNTVLVIVVVWTIIILANIPLIFNHGIHEYHFGVDRSTCINLVLIRDKGLSKIFYGSFFVFGYMLPLSLICVLYGFLLKRLLYGVVPGGSQSAESIRSKKRVTKMVVIVVVIFALCWLPIQVVFMVQTFGTYANNMQGMAVQMAANCIAYMNSCVNPVIYAFMSENFRYGFLKCMRCGSGKTIDYARANMTCSRDNTFAKSADTIRSTSLQQCTNGSPEHKIQAVNSCVQTDL